MPATSFEGCWLSQNDSAETQGLNSKNARLPEAAAQHAAMAPEAASGPPKARARRMARIAVSSGDMSPASSSPSVPHGSDCAATGCASAPTPPNARARRTARSVLPIGESSSDSSTASLLTPSRAAARALAACASSAPPKALARRIARMALSNGESSLSMASSPAAPNRTAARALAACAFSAPPNAPARRIARKAVPMGELSAGSSFLFRGDGALVASVESDGRPWNERDLLFSSIFVPTGDTSGLKA
eukprot:CAMPEP_0181419374 /NCGR_PEP_ID=MMETSP1110-20121109/12039_1 /TAXON_ID=174948 /ORGANISM="Symbiodinium sp., Strain CCMP421" /LENGTH=247 /DNA_ID=CAMNT_0023542385 /DNA_START=176 /DNA_END=918 /DNA_ORIENTATION=-